MSLSIILPTQCDICPRRCGANRAAGKRGTCGADDTLRIARAALHEWEEPCISVGAGSGTVFFTGCPLRCSYCQNYDIAHGDHGTVITLERLVDIYFELVAKGAANINLVTPTQYVPQIIATVAEARKRGLDVPVVYNTSGYETAQTVQALKDTVDVYLADFKYWRDEDSDAARKYSKAPGYFQYAADALDAMVEQTGKPKMVQTPEGDWLLVKGVVVRHLLLPGRVDESMMLMNWLWNRYGNDVLYSVMNQFTPCREVPGAPELNGRCSDEDYDLLLDYLDYLGMENYFWQQGGAAEESFIPPFDNTGVLPE